MRDQSLASVPRVSPAYQLMTTAGVARRLQITPDGVRYLARTGQLPFERTEGPLRVFRRSEVERVEKARAESRGQSRATRLAAVRPRMLQANLKPRQTRLRLVRAGGRGER
jgi:excisionase family DNA binding protein